MEVLRWRELFGSSKKERYEYRCPACGFINIRYEKNEENRVRQVR